MCMCSLSQCANYVLVVLSIGGGGESLLVLPVTLDSLTDNCPQA